MKIRFALISVSDRSGLSELGLRLRDLGVKIISSGGTARALQEAGVEVIAVSQYTGFPEILDGRVKTLHPRVHGGILARHDDARHQATLREHEIEPIGLVVVNLYPFEATVSRTGVGYQEAIENIDIGGPALIRAAAKNSDHVAVAVDPGDYSQVLAEMLQRDNELSLKTRRRLARKAFRHTAQYDAAIAAYFEAIDQEADGLPGSILLSLVKQDTLRYGENPHQRAALFRPLAAPPWGLAAARQLQGKQLSFNNYLDLEAAWALCREFDEPFCAIIKHNNPCGAAVAAELADAYQKALDCDPVSAFGSVIGFNRHVDAQTAERISTLFIEAVIAPSFSKEALDLLGTKKNLRLLDTSGETNFPSQPELNLDYKRVRGAFLVQDPDLFYLQEKDLRVVTRRAPDRRQMADLLFAWKVCKHVKSNAIVLASGGATVGIGAGQMSRVDSVRLAVEKSRSDLQGAVMASDAFFPFRDGIDAASQAGIGCVIQPGGSVRDSEVIVVADELGLAMVFTGIRHFRH